MSNTPAGLGHNSDGPTDADYRSAMAQDILDREALKAVANRRKMNRKLAQSKGIVLEHLDRAMSMSEEPIGTILDWFKGRAAAFSSIMPNMTGSIQQLKLFEENLEPSEVAAHFHAGLMPGLKGTTPKAPDGLVGEKLQEFMKGHQQGADARAEREKSLAETLAQALKNADEGKVTDGTGKKGRSAKAKAVGLKAAADFAKDNPGPTAEEQQFGNGGQPAGLKTGDETFEATDEELAAQKGRISQSDHAAEARQEAGIDA